MVGVDTIGECVAKLRELGGLTYEVARSRCAPLPVYTPASTSEVLGRFWPALLLVFVLAVAVPLVVSWDQGRRGKYSA